MAKGFDVGLARKPKMEAGKTLGEQGFILVTDNNRANAIIRGRIVYRIGFASIRSRKQVIVGFFQIYPRFTKGWWKIPHYPWDLVHPFVNGDTHWNCLWDKDWEYEDWMNTFKNTIDRGIQEQNLYIKLSDPILTYIQSSQK